MFVMNCVSYIGGVLHRCYAYFRPCDITLYAGDIVIYFIREGQTNNVKVGFSNNPSIRIKNLQTGNPRPLTLENRIERVSKHSETILHHHLKAKGLHINNEWFLLTKRQVKCLVKDVHIAFPAGSSDTNSDWCIL